ncbi:uncharacterized protein RHOBADRAFT_53707 [Rhodotorula graminis WP1]|uniref:Zn(2)-C6 fungal-type domain-containing protein n=1 Tax=Rhodotorula graminis (strain WP1) TaxID=578459 RepID=A0A194S2D6_RHOGW|nr:uncharacterized protein RHOBADRAFT_53707 [Rhodotorula graminis WP1]KPV74762.1 hypothetical protein RHOBADRAFT_53707 [Rhodotorula graminis WP1]
MQHDSSPQGSYAQLPHPAHQQQPPFPPPPPHHAAPPPGPNPHPQPASYPAPTTAGPPSASTSPRTSIAGSVGPDAAKQRAGSYVPTRVADPISTTVKRSAKACLYCRRSKARCTGLESWPCRRCREGGIECVFEGISTDDLRKKMDDKPPSNSSMSPLEARLARLESELALIRSAASSHTARLDRLERREGDSQWSEVGDSDGLTPPDGGKKRHRRDSAEFQAFASKAFDLFWEMYAPLAPYIVPTTDHYGQVKDRSPLLMHCIIAVASRHSNETALVEFNRTEALRLMRETLYAERPVTLDDLKGSLVWGAWLGKGAPPGHAVTLALQLDLPRCLERLVASASAPASAAEVFEQLMPAARIWLTLYAQDIWLSFSLNRRPLVTIDVSVTSSRLLLAFPALRPVDARLIAQSELVTVLGVVQESFLKLQRQSVEQTIQVVQQANSHLEQWIGTWAGWAGTQEEEAGRYVLASFSVMLQSARFFVNTLGLRDITSAEEFLPIHLPFLRTALDAAVRIQGIHRAHKVAHSAEMTMISLSSGALFLLKMIKLVPTAFASNDCPAYPSSAFPASFSKALAEQLTSASSPDTSASSQQQSFPSIKQAFAAARHSAALLSCAPRSQQKRAQAVKAAVERLEAEMTVPHPSLLAPLATGAAAAAAAAASGAAKRPREDDALSSPARPSPRGAPPHAPSPYWSLGLGFSPGGTVGTGETATPPAGFWATDSGDVLAVAARNGEANGGGGGGGGEGAAAQAGASGPAELDELTIESLIGTDSFWNWSSALPAAQDIHALVS